MAGFGAHQALHTTKAEVLSEHLPIRVIEIQDTTSM
jgi:PII-like signaling protein